MTKGVNGVVTDELLVRQARAGDCDAFVQFASRWWPMIGRIAWSMLGNTAQAAVVTEEVLEIVLRSPRPSDAPVGLSMYSLAIWLAIVRRRSSRPRLAPESRVLEALDGVHCMDRAAFVLREIADVPIADVAAILETSAQEIRHQVHRVCLVLTCLLGDAADQRASDLRRLGTSSNPSAS